MGLAVMVIVGRLAQGVETEMDGEGTAFFVFRYTWPGRRFMRCFSWISKLFLAGLLLLSQLTVPAQQSVAQKKNMQSENVSTIVGHYSTIVVDAQVLSANTGLVVGDLTRQDFVITENDVQQEIFAWQRLPAPLSLLIVVDSAANDANRHAVDNQISALKLSLVDWLEPGDEVGIMAMSERPIVLQDYTNDKQLITAALDTVSQYRTASELKAEKRLSRELQEAVEHARGGQTLKARCAIILISDLPERTARELIMPEAVVRATLETNNIFCWKRSAHSTPRFFDEGKYSLDKMSITDLVNLTGGEFVDSDWESFLERLRRRYRIVYLPFTRQRSGQVVRIKLTLKPSAKLDTSNFVLNYRRLAIIPFER